MNWGYYIKELRERSGLTQGELAKKSRLTRSHISRIETGAFSTWKEKVLKQLANALDVPFNELLQKIYGASPASQEQERPEDLIRQALITFPDTVPIYEPEEFALRLSGPVEPSDFVYRRKYPEYKNVVGCYAYGRCLEPEIKDGDILIVDDNIPPQVGDIAVCLIENKLHTGRITLIENVPYLVNHHGQVALSQCQRSWLIIEIRRRLR